MKKLIAGPWVGEFGYFLFTWQARLRWLAHNEYEKVVVICRPGQECIFQDFASEIIVWDKPLPDTAVGAGCPPAHLTFKDTYNEKGSDRFLPGKAIVKYNWRHKIPVDPAFSQQEFIVFGDNTNTKGYDVILHVRSTTKRGQGYKNNFDGWDFLLDNLKGSKVACIGTDHQSDHIPGTDDRRGIPLRELTTLMRSSKVLVGASSGPIHLAALCDLPHVTWVGRPILTKYRTALLRYREHWNPFKVPVRAIYNRTWNPAPQRVLDYTKELLEGVDK